MARRNRAAVDHLLRSPIGPVGQDLTRRAIRVENMAKTLCPVDRGRLRSSIDHTDPQPIGRGLVVQIGTNVEYALAVHEGSGSDAAPRSWQIAHARGHTIPPRRFLTNALPAGRG
jgi:phage gpG-like protein